MAASDDRTEPVLAGVGGGLTGPAPLAASAAGFSGVGLAAAGAVLGGGGLRGWRLRRSGGGEPGWLAVRGVARAFGGVRAVNGVDLAVAPGEVVGLIGPNGAGKTTLFEIIAGFTRPQAGDVRFGGRVVTDWSPQRRARHGLVRSFQDARLFPAMSVHETVMVAGERLAPSSLTVAALGATGRFERRTQAHTDELLDLMGLQAQAGTAVGALSTGTRRMVELTCLLAMRPTLMLLDEPSSGVSHADGLALAELLRHINKELGISLLVIEHDLPLLAGLADRMVAMEAGRIIAAGTPEQVRTHPEVVRSYLGVAHA
jgi:ABC-type branched-subunit amino acid transport system ATPase component